MESVCVATNSFTDPRPSFNSMSSTIDQSWPGGFLHPSLPSPPSTTRSTPSAAEILPHPRSTPLKPGGAKESSFIAYVDAKLLGISRRYEKRFNADFEDAPSHDLEGKGYESFGDLATDVQGIIDIVWISGTREILSSWLRLSANTVISYSIATNPVPPHNCAHNMFLPPFLPLLTLWDFSAVEQARPSLLLASARH